MNHQLIACLFFVFFFLLLVAASHLLHHYFKLGVDQSRKFLHITGGLLSLYLPFFIINHWYVLFICSLAFLLLTVTYAANLLSAVHRTNRWSVGSMLFPIPVYVCFFAATVWNNHLLFFLPISILTLADPAAEWGGKKWGRWTTSYFSGQKTAAGTLSFAVVALLLSILCALYFKQDATQIILLVLMVTISSSLAELVGLKGFDNLTIPITSLAALLLFV